MKELLESEPFLKFKNHIFIGHSKGANLAILCAHPMDTVICVAGRYKLDEFPEDTFSQAD